VILKQGFSLAFSFSEATPTYSGTSTRYNLKAEVKVGFLDVIGEMKYRCRRFLPIFVRFTRFLENA
jgi:hypothetical protein